MAPAQGLRDVGESIVLMGKNTMMKRSIRLYCERTGDNRWPALTEILVGNVGLIFTKADLAEVLPCPPACLCRACAHPEALPIAAMVRC